MKIEAYKNKFNKSTSESLFGIIDQPENQCPLINNGLKIWYNTERDIKSLIRDLSRIDSIEEAEDIASDIDWSIGSLDIVKEYEELRSKCQQIRAWGEDWKSLAKKLIEERDNIDDLLP